MSLIKNGVSLRKMENQEVTELFYVCWAFAKKHYGQIMFFSILSIVFPLVIRFGVPLLKLPIPGLPTLVMGLGGLFTVVSLYGTFQVFKKWEAGQSASLGTFFSFLSKTTDRKPYFILIAILIVNSIVVTFFQPEDASSGLYFLTFGIILLGMVLNLFSSLIIPLIAFQKLNLSQAFEVTLAVVIENIVPLFLIYIGITVLSLVSLLMCGLPYFFLVMPLVFGLFYFFYRATCEGLILDRKNYLPQTASPDNNH